MLETLVTGSGDPVTVFAHGLAGGIPDTRPLGSNVAGSRVFFHFRGHGGSGAPAGAWTYRDLAADLARVADASGATRALGVSLGAGALTRLVSDQPERFERLVFFLPAVLDVPRPLAARERLSALIAAVRSGDRAAVAAQVARDVPEEFAGNATARSYIANRTNNLLSCGLGDGLSGLPEAVAIADLASLRDVTAPALVIGCRADVMHPAEVAERMAESLPNATLHVYEDPHPLWRNRADLRRRISEFLNDETLLHRTSR